VDGESISSIGQGLAVYLGVERGDVRPSAEYLSKKIANLRIFSDANGKMNLSVLDVKGEILLISQFTLLANCNGGNRPDFLQAEEPSKAKETYLEFGKLLEARGVPVKYGIFGADMQIEQLNDGPVTIIL